MAQRIKWVETSKGITISLMVIGHTSIPLWLSNWIWSFHMPFFFIISALFTKWDGESTIKFINRKSKILLLPFLVYSLINLALYPLSLGVSHMEYARHVILHGWGGVALWFVIVFYVTTILCKLIYRHEILFACLALIIGIILCNNKIVLPWALSSVPFALFLELMVKTNQKKIQFFFKTLSLKNITIIGIIGLVGSLIISYFWHLDMAWNKIQPIIPLLAGIILGVAFTFTLSILLCFKKNIIAKIFFHIGRNTYEILGLSQIIIISINHFLGWGSVFKYLAMIIILTCAVYIRKLIEGKYSKIDVI